MNHSTTRLNLIQMFALTAALLFYVAASASDDKLAVLSGRDAENATDYVVFSLAGEPHPSVTVASADATSIPAPPYVTFQCRQSAGRRRIDLFVDFGNVGNRAYHAPEKPDPVTGFPQPHPNAVLQLTFVGYITSKPFKRTWAVLPNGELQYRAPGSYSPNMEDVRYFITWLSSLPKLRVTDVHDANKSVEFQTGALIEPLRRNPLCQP